MTNFKGSMESTVNYCWDYFPECSFYEVKDLIEGPENDGEYIGSIRAGRLCFDCVLRCYDNNNMSLDYDVYIGGVDSGYGYTIENYGYDYCDGGSLTEGVKLSTYEQFKQYVEQKLNGFLQKNDYHLNLYELAQTPLLVW